MARPFRETWVGVSINFGAEIATDLDPEIEKICQAAVPTEGISTWRPQSRSFTIVSNPEASIGLAQGVIDEVRRLDVARHGPLPGSSNSGGDAPQESQDGFPGVHA